MAKDNRPIISLKCAKCKRIGYHTKKNINNTKEPLKLKKHCRFCRAHNDFIETKK